jgi:hypothetical protein
VVGVVETGLFVGMATTVLVATPAGMIRLDRSCGGSGVPHDLDQSR